MRKSVNTSQRGSISIFTMVTMIFFLVTIMSIYMISSKRAQMQTESVKLVQDKYYTPDEEKVAYQNKIAESTKTIPIYTKEQLWSVGSGEAIQIEGKVYTFSEGANYQLQNDIVINLEGLTSLITVDETKINKNNCAIYYYYQGNYYVPAFGDTVDLTLNGNNFVYYAI